MKVCEALADDIRAQIVTLLAKGDLTAGQIADQFSVSRPAVSRHLRVLREAGLVSVTFDAQRRVYRLNLAPLLELEEWVARQRRLCESRLDALGRHLDLMAQQERSNP
jgi:DNA-binding transcriptional ArsR family regulator